MHTPFTVTKYKIHLPFWNIIVPSYSNIHNKPTASASQKNINKGKEEVVIGVTGVGICACYLRLWLNCNDNGRGGIVCLFIGTHCMVSKVVRANGMRCGI